MKSVKAASTWCTTHCSDAIFCEDFDRYCQDGLPAPEACPPGAKPASAAIRKIWARDKTCTELKLDLAYFASPPFGGRYPCQGDAKIGQMTVDLLEGIHRVFGMSASAVMGTDSNPLILEFVIDGLTGMKVHHANGYMELTMDNDRAPTHYVQFTSCGTSCETGPATQYTVICQQESPPKGSPDIAMAPHHASIAVGCLSFLDTDPCHCGSPQVDQTPTNDHLAYFDGYKWYSLRKGLFPGAGDFRLQNRANVIRLTVKAATVRIEMTTPETGDRSWCEAPRDYRGQFNTLHAGVGRGCLIDGNSWTECHGNTRCLKGAPQAGSLVFDNVAIHGGASSAGMPAVTAEIRAVGVLENNAGRYSSCVAISEDGQWVVGNSRGTDSNRVLVDCPFRWSNTTGMLGMGAPHVGNSYVTGAATLWDGSLIACGNVGGLAQKWHNGSWTALPGQREEHRNVYCISRDPFTQEVWIGGSSFPAENEKGYRYRWSNDTYIGFWGYYQDVYGIAHSGLGVGKNNWGNWNPNPEYRHDHPILIFNWMENCSGGGKCGWDQINRFEGYGDTNYYKGCATAISPSAKWVVGYLTWNPTDMNSSHAFKWPVPSDLQLAPVPAVNWPRPVDLGTLPSDERSFAYCISDTAPPVIGGGSYRASRGERAVYWDGTGIHDLAVVLRHARVDLSRWSSLNQTLGISADGRIMCGIGYYDDDNNPATPAIQMGFVVDFATPLLPKSLCPIGTVLP